MMYGVAFLVEKVPGVSFQGSAAAKKTPSGNFLMRKEPCGPSDEGWG